MPTVSPSAQAILEFIYEALRDLAEELTDHYEEVEIRLHITAH
jgi:hypothetical protein